MLAVYGAYMLAKEEPTATRQGLSPGLLVTVFEVFFSPRLNTLINPAVTPPLALLMAVLGAVALWKAERRAVLAWILAWAFGFFLVHSVVTEPTMQPRYHLPLTIPLALLAGRGLSRLFEWKRPAGIAGVVYLAAAPLMHLGFIRDVDFTDLHEYAFLVRMRDVIPAGCLVVEYAGQHAADARIPRMGAYIEQGVLKNRWRSMAVVRTADHSLDEDVSGQLAQSTGCTHLYQGLACYSVKPPELPIAPECRALSEAAPLTRVDGAELEAHAYNSGALGDLARTGGRVTISLDRAGRSR